MGRARATEDVDLFIQKISKNSFLGLVKELDNSGFWCINSDSPETMFNYINEGIAIRFARKETAIPNFEIKFPKNEIECATFDDPLTVVLNKDQLFISSLERQIAFKRYFLRSDKDLEDAMHIEVLFKQDIDYGKINNIKESIEHLD